VVPVGLNAPMAQGDDAFDDGDLRARAAAVRAEWRADEEEWTRAAYEQFEHGRTLVDVLRSCMHRGDRISVVAGDTTFRGIVTGVGPDTARLQLGVDPDDVVDVNLAAAPGVVLRVDAPARAGGTRGDADVTFRARALARERTTSVAVGVVHPPLVVTGTVRVGSDHLRVSAVDGSETSVSLRAVSWIRRAAG
jgi:hypothetical protein